MGLRWARNISVTSQHDTFGFFLCWLCFPEGKLFERCSEVWNVISHGRDGLVGMTTDDNVKDV